MAEDPDPEATAIALAAHASSEFSGAKVAGVTPLLVTIVEARELPFSADTFVLVESGGARNQTEVQRSSAAPVWDHLFTLRADFKPGVREELVATLWHEDVYEDQLVGQATVDLTDVLHERLTLEVWVPLLDERRLRRTGAELLLRVQNGKAPPLVQVCADENVTIEGLERTILQDPAQCDEREVADEGTGRLCVHLLLENKLATDEMLSLLLKANTKQARVADRHGNLALHYVCKRYAVTEAQLTLTLRCHPGAAAAANRFGKLPLHLLSRNPCLTKGMLHLLLAPHPAALHARDQAGNTPLHYLAQNKSLSKEVLQAFLAACGEEGGKAAVEATNKYGAVPLRKLVTSDAFTDQHLRVMLRASDAVAQARDRYGRAPLDYLHWNKEVTPFQAHVADEMREQLRKQRAAHGRGSVQGRPSTAEVPGAFGAPAPAAEPEARLVDDVTAVKKLLAVQKYSLWFIDFSAQELASLQQGANGHGLLVSRFRRDDVLLRRGQAATFVAILLEGEVGVRLDRTAGGGFPRRLQRGSLLGERGLFDSGISAADVVALTDGYVATMLYSEIELLGDAYPELMRKFNLQLAKAALEDKLADTGMTLSDLGDSQLQEHLHALFKKQQRGQWKAQHKALQELREGLYREVYEELHALGVMNDGDVPEDKHKTLGGALKSVFRRKK